ncbi:MAG: multicopper oxidase domain-containing protein [Nitrosomonas sp.]|nr:multicopper oxidase domain-containing protein [Nitrosomonas sp.]
MLTRRTFLKFTAGGTLLTLFGFDKQTGIPKAIAQIPFNEMLDPSAIPKYLSPLLIPPAMPRAGKITIKGGKNIDYYEIAVRQFLQQILPTGMPPTTVWGYGPAVTRSSGEAAIFNAPSLTIEAKHNMPVRIKWINDLTDTNGNFLPHLLPVDPTLHWANPPGGTNGRDTRPNFAETPDPYTGPVPMVTHVHGAASVGDESDGYAEAWYLPDASNIPSNYATVGSWYDFFKSKANTNFGATWGPGYATFQYPNANRASTLWYHDHTLGLTRLNVYAGPAGFYIIRGGPGDNVLDSRTGIAAILPSPAPALGDPPSINYYEIPIAIQDRTFKADGSLFYPNTRAFFDGILGDYLPSGEFPPIWNPEFFGNTIMVNGSTWPFQTVEQRRYRFRFLNGCQSRFLILDFNQIPGVEVWAIGNEGDFLNAPVNLSAMNGNHLLIGPAERVDVIVDFTNVPVGSHILNNVGPDEPFGGGLPGVDFPIADGDTTGQIMVLNVVTALAADPTTPPEFLQFPTIAPLPPATVVRRLALIEKMGMGHDEHGITEGPVEALLGTLGPDSLDPTVPPGVWVERKWMDAVTENPSVGTTEIWEFYNTTGDAHPMHVHEVLFEVVNRQALVHDDEDEIAEPVELDGPIIPPKPWESGLKDTVTVYPGQVTRVKATFSNAGQFVWHCHIVEHEDNEMMRPYRIGPVQPGQPGEM